MSGAGTLLRLALRRDRRVLPLWVLGLTALVVLAGASLGRAYPTQIDRDAFAAGVTGNGALIALRGPQYALDTAGGALAWQLGWFTAVLAGLMGALLVVRHTRGDEEAGRAELVLAAPAGRAAPLAAGLLVAALAAVLVGAGLALGLLATGLPVTGSIAFGAAASGVALVLAGVGAVAAQVAATARAASGIAGAVLGAAYVVRAIGDVGDGTLSWLSPIGWAQAVRPYAGERWWPLALMLVVAAALVAAAFGLLERRDQGAGLLRPGPGPPAASAALRRPEGLALRLQRGAALGWAAGLGALGAAYGSFARDVGDLLDTSAQIEDYFTRAGGATIVDSFLATTVTIIALLAGGFTVQAVLRLRGEEVAGRAETLLATPLTRARWAASHALVALAGTAVLLALAGAAMGLADALRGGGAAQVPRLAGAALAQAPAAWLLGALALAVVGLRPRASALAWAPLAWCVVAGMLGPLLGLPDAIADATPYALAPSAPADPVTAGPLLALTAATAAVGALGIAGLRRRDITP